MRLPGRLATAALFVALTVLPRSGPPLAAQSLGGCRVYIGRPPAPNPLATDNGIPGTGAYAYDDYDWPSLRQALQTYGLFGRRACRPAPSPAAPPPWSPYLPQGR